MKSKDLEKFLAKTGLSYVLLTKKQKKAIQQEWRQTYAIRVHDKTGEWQYLGYDWHAFSYNYTRCFDGEIALRKYLECKTSSFMVVPEDGAISAYECSGWPLPDFTGLHEDIHVFPRNLAWTMAFTHEQPELGPYYSEASNQKDTPDRKATR